MTSDANLPTFVVGIGASAGGLEAVERMFDQMPEESGMAFVLVQHLSPDFKSLMNELLTRRTKIPIHQAVDGIQLRANNIYLMPPKKQMVVSEGTLLLTDKDPKQGLTFPIDHFFRSLANDYGPRSISVVLSGTGSDGSRGIGDVHEAGGLVIVQRGDTAKFDGMPKSAVDSGVCDLSLSPEAIPDALLRYGQNTEATLTFHDSTSGQFESDSLGQIFGVLDDAYDLDFTNYKPTTVNRRIERRLLLTGTPDLSEYAELLCSDPQELELLYRDLLIGVTRFFRDSEAFKALHEKAIEELIDEAGEGDDIRVWVSGCATGEEAYSMAILFDEMLREKRRKLNVKIFASDINTDSLDFAANAQYTVDRIVGVSEERRERYFAWHDPFYEVDPAIRQMVVFAPHNLTKDPPFTKIDLISCRNFLIYIQPPTQRKILSLFHFGLKTNGILFLGSSEVCDIVGDGFDTVDNHWKIFRKSREGRLPDDMRVRFSGTPRKKTEATGKRADQQLLLSTYDALLESVLPPSLLVSAEGRLLHTFGDAGKLFKPEAGRMSVDVLERLRPEFQFAVSAGMRKAETDDRPVLYSGIAGVDSEAFWDVTVTAIDDRRLKQRSFLVQITPQSNELPSLPNRIDVDNISTEQISALELELRHSKESLQSTIEELESSNEELQATNEELISSNEELQSTNEELHSVNEELYTVNAEHQNKISQLSELTRDMDNLLDTTEVHTIFLDSDLAIRKFTPRVAEKFNFLKQDVGRRIDDFTHSINCVDLPAKIRQVIDGGRSHQEEVQDRIGSWFLLRILPYRAHQAEDVDSRKIDGALLTLIDISKLKETSDALEESLKQRDRFLAMLSHELRNPLGTIVNATHLLSSNSEIDENTHEAVAVVKRQSTHMSTLLADLLDVTRVSQGKIQLQKRPFDLLQSVTNALETVRTRCDARSQNIETNFPLEPVWVYGSEPRILQVISNLLTNASKYSPPGEVFWLSVEVENDDTVIRVRDNGVGIPADQIDKVFEMFVQSDRTLDRADGGLGVGLTLVRSLVELHGGSVGVESEGEGKGSEFFVRLPLCDEPRAVPFKPPAAPSATHPSRIVLVEDSVDASKMLAFLLEDAGYQVSVAHDGRRGLELIRKELPDTAVIDIGLPEINGYELANLIRNEPELDDVFLVALTGYGQHADRDQALTSGFDEHLVKPVDPDVLHEVIANRSKAARQRTDDEHEYLPNNGRSMRKAR